MTGLTGLVKFDHEGFRTDFKLDILELTAEGLMKKGTWNLTEGVNFTQTYEMEEPVGPSNDLRNVTFVVMISLVSFNTAHSPFHSRVKFSHSKLLRAFLYLRLLQ